MDPSYVCPPSVTSLADLECVDERNMYILTACVSSPHTQCKSQKAITLHFEFDIRFILFHPFFYVCSLSIPSSFRVRFINSRHDSRPEHRQRKERGYS
jgi:hypothetical protein